MSEIIIGEKNQQVSLCEALDRVLNKGAVIVGEVTISVADIDLVYLGLQAVLTSVETAKKMTQTQLEDHLREPQNEHD